MLSLKQWEGMNYSQRFDFITNVLRLDFWEEVHAILSGFELSELDSEETDVFTEVCARNDYYFA